MMDQDYKRKIPHKGKVKWIGVRPGKGQNLKVVEEILVDPETGLDGDHYKGQSRIRQVTLIQEEHLSMVANILGLEEIDPGQARRNIVVSGINLYGLKKQEFSIGDEVVLEMTGFCHPCSNMEKTIGPGAFQAMRGHGGYTAMVKRGGKIRIGDQVAWIESAVELDME